MIIKSNNLKRNTFENFYLWSHSAKVHIFWEGHKIFEISALLLTGTTDDKCKVEISQNFVAFSELTLFRKIDLFLIAKLDSQIISGI